MKTHNRSIGSSFILQFLTDTAEHAANSTQTVTAPYVELGRDQNCGICFGDDVPTVSHKHAALERKGQKIFIYNLSGTNQTLVNGRPVLREWLLHHGDEIQLSADGPRMRVVLPADNPAPRFTGQIKLFVEQTAKPYRFVLFGLLLIFLAGAAAVGIQFTRMRSSHKQLESVARSVMQQMEEQEKALAEGNSELIAGRKEQAEELAGLNKQNQDFQEALVRQSRIIKALVGSATAKPVRKTVAHPPVPAKPNPEQILIGSTQGKVYALQIFMTVKDNSGEPLSITNEHREKVHVKDYFIGSGTGFVLEDGRFITSRRWVKPWAYPEGEKDALALFANFVHHNGGNASVKVVATAPDGPELTLFDRQFSTDSTYDQPVIGNFGFGEGKIMVANREVGRDWAVSKVPVTGLPYQSGTLPAAGTEVHFLGYEIPLGTQGGPAGAPTYTKRTVAAGESAKGTLPVTGVPFEPSTYGGPAYLVKEGEPLVVGLLNEGKDGKGIIIPISHVPK